MTPQERKERLRRQQQLLGVVPQTAPSPAADEDTRREALRVAQDNLDFMGQELQDPQDPSAFGSLCNCSKILLSCPKWLSYH